MRVRVRVVAALAGLAVLLPQESEAAPAITYTYAGSVMHVAGPTHLVESAAPYLGSTPTGRLAPMGDMRFTATRDRFELTIQDQVAKEGTVRIWVGQPGASARSLCVPVGKRVQIRGIGKGPTSVTLALAGTRTGWRCTADATAGKAVIQP